MFNPAIASENIRNEFIDYVSTMYSFADQGLQKQFIDELEHNISKGPYLEMKDVFKSGHTIKELIEKGVLSSLFQNLESKKPNSNLYKRCLPVDRPLYLHQEQAIETIVGGKNAVISTGTGSGKTNCFLIPVLNELLREQESGTLGPGVRAMFIYPMNALANDQMKNIRNILMYYPDITFGVYNGGTENEEDKAISVYEAMFSTERVEELRHRLPNELLSRDEMKASPPNILFTNYAMLEHLLFRPKDDVLFSNSDFRFVVLDEAHVYTGATGIETALLLRRLRARINTNQQTQFILTSATLGSDERSDGDIVKFAENLCGVSFDKKSIIRSSRESFCSPSNITNYPNELYQKLSDEQNIASEVLKGFGIPCDSSKSESEIIYDIISTSDLYTKLRRYCSEIVDLTELQKVLDVDLETSISFISLCTRATKGGKSLIDARYHYFIRSLEGCFVTLSPEKKLFFNRQKTVSFKNVDYEVFEASTCEECGKLAIVGTISDSHLVQASKMGQKVDFFYLAEDGNDDIDDIDDEEEEEENAEPSSEKKDESEEFVLCPHCGAIVESDEVQSIACGCPKSDLIKVKRARNLSIGARCGNCHSGTYRRYYLGNDAATSVLATSLYEELPELEYDADSVVKGSSNMFAKASSASRKISKKTGRQFLVFSDSRQEAAKFACYLGKSYEEFLRRRGICQVSESEHEAIVKLGYSVDDLVLKLTNFFTSKKSFASSNTDTSNLTVRSNSNAWVALLNELAHYSSATSLSSLGFIQFHYKGNTDSVIEGISREYGVSEDIVRNLLDYLALEVIKRGAVVANSDNDINDNDREYIFYSPTQKFIKLLKSPEEKVSNIISWMPREKKGKPGEYHKNTRIYHVCKSLNVPEQEAARFIKQYFEYLHHQDNLYGMISPNSDGLYVMPARHFDVLVPGSRNARWFYCKKCGRVSPFSMNGHCISVRCDGSVKEIEPSSIRENNHYASLYLNERMSPLLIKEHTAQLSKKESAQYQEEFVKKTINALSCSTTFEMGVDVGDLETVFLRNVPPLPSNYAQRAGRAGRSLNAAAYALTYAKLSSHDLSFFSRPKEMICGTILPPLFKIDNEKIVRRHVYAVALSMFFSIYVDQYNHNDAEKFINEKGYEKFISWLNTKPERLKTMLLNSIPNENDLHARIGLNDFSWVEGFSGKDGVFTELISEYEGNVKNFKDIIAKLKKENDLDKASKCDWKLKIYQRNKLIEFLARGNILPRYGFPVDTVELEQNSSSNSLSKLRLSRDLQVAIAEYAPSSEIIADGHMYTSRYIKKAQIGNEKKDWHTSYIGICPNPKCGTMNVSHTPVTREGYICSACGQKMGKIDFEESIEPKNGFVADEIIKPVPMTKQEKNYKTEDFYIGNLAAKTINKYYYSLGEVCIKVESTTNDSLMVKSMNDFYVCPKCGYSVAEDESVGDKKTEKEMLFRSPIVNMSKIHRSLYGNHNCENKTFVRRSLHHIFNTDVAKISFACGTSDYRTMVSAMYAILYSICHELNIERRDLKACLSLKLTDNVSSYSIIIYDAVPGGAGHSRRLITEDGRLLQRIFEQAYAKMTECNCDPSCYNCLRSYENQRIHDVLDRKLASDFLEQFIGNVSVLKETNDLINLFC